MSEVLSSSEELQSESVNGTPGSEADSTVNERFYEKVIK